MSSPLSNPSRLFVAFSPQREFFAGDQMGEVRVWDIGKEACSHELVCSPLVYFMGCHPRACDRCCIQFTHWGHRGLVLCPPRCFISHLRICTRGVL